MDKPDSLKTGADRLCRKKRRRNAKTGQNVCAAAWDFLKASSPPPLAEEEFKTFLEKTIAAQSRANPAYGGERLSQRCDERQDHNLHEVQPVVEKRHNPKNFGENRREPWDYERELYKRRKEVERYF